MNSLLSLAAVLFILSMIIERIVNFFKLPYSGSSIFGIKIGNLKNRKPDAGEEDTRTKKIMGISIFFGTLVAISIRADLIAIMSHIEKPADGMGWDSLTGNWYLTLVPGCFLTGCFLSAGSKFWHDLFGLIRQMKEYKRTLTDAQKISNSQAVANGLNQQPSPSKTNYLHFQPAGIDMAHLAIQNNHGNLLMQYPNINKLMPAYHVTDEDRQPCVDICLSDDCHTHMPLFLNYQNPDGTAGSIKTRIIRDFQHVQPQAGRGEMIINTNSPAAFGTIACILKGKITNELYALTCNHVLTAGRFASPGNLGEEADELLVNSNVLIGKWVAGKMDNRVDVALVSLDDPGSAEPNDLSSSAVYHLEEKDQGVVRVELIGAVSGFQRAFVIHINQLMHVDYEDKTVELAGLFTLSAGTNPHNFSPVTQKGDSGALICHSVTRQPIGIVLGGNRQFTFGIPMSSVLGAFPELALTILNN